MATQPMLDDNGQPLPLFGFLNAHDAFRRDLPRFAAVPPRLAAGELDDDALDALRQHWFVYRTFLEEHHTFEDNAMFRTVAADEPTLKPLVDDLAAQHDHLHDLLPRITALLEQAEEPGELAEAFARLTALLEPHFAAEEEHLVPILRAAMASGPAGPPPRRDEDDGDSPVAAAYGLPFTVEHLDERVRTLVLPLFPNPPEPAQVETWLADYRRRVALWAS